MKERASYVILLVGLWWSPFARAGYSCPQPNGYFPDPDNCEIYYRCIEGGWDRHSCGPGTVFNPNHNTCDYPSRVPGCGGHDSSNNPPKSTETPEYPTPEYPTPDYPTPEYPTPEYPTTTPYPTTRYRTTRYPTTESRTTPYRPTTRYPPTRPPQTRPPPTKPPPTRKPTTRYIPSSRYPTTTSRYTPPRATQPNRDYGKFYCESDGYFGHPKYCDHFYRCVMTRPILFACAPGTYFDDIIGTCNYKEQITECDENGIKHGGPRPTYRPSQRPSQPPSGRPSHKPSTSSWTSAMPSWSPAFSDYFTTTTSFPSTSAEIFICPNRCGFYPHPTRCDQFVVCMDFEAKLHNCPPELYFNWQAKTCDYKENVQCYISNFENIYKKK